MSTVKLIQKQNGLNFQYDPLEAPEGSYTVADNVWTNREGLIESRRGMDRFGAAAADRIDVQFEFADRIHRQDDSGNLEYDTTGAGVFGTHAGTFLKPAADVRMRTVESRRQNFLTTSLGVFSQDALTQAPTRAGIEPFLELTATLAGTGTPSGHLVPDSVTGYRAVFGRENLNQRILRGAPSEQTRIVSPTFASTYAWAAGVTTVTTLVAHGYLVGDVIEIISCDDPAMVGFFTLTGVAALTFTFAFVGPAVPANGNLVAGKYWAASLEFPIPDDVVAGDFYEIYRTNPSATAATAPGEIHYLVKQEVVTAANILLGTITYADTTPDDLLDRQSPLYTNPSLGAGSRPNDRPPYAIDLADFKGHLHYAAALWEQERDITCKSLTGIAVGVGWLEFGGERYTFQAAENVGLGEFQLYTTGTAAENIRDTMFSLVRVVNRASATFYAFYVSGSDGAPGKVLIRHRALNGVPFDFVANLAATGDNFEPQIPTAAATLYSDTPGGENVIAVSKFEQPEAVPRLSTNPVGTERKRIERIVKLRDVLVILKQLDGFWVETGPSDGTVGAKFEIKQRDPTCHIYGRDTACVLQNRVVCYSSQGFVACDENGAEIIGRQVEERLESIRATADWDSLAFAFGYESEDMYICFGPTDATDTQCNRAWVYSSLREKFTNGFVKPVSAGHVLGYDEKFYLAHDDDDYTLQERKGLAYTGSDYRDEGIDCTITATSTMTNADGNLVSLITVNYAYAGAALGNGFQLAQGILEVKVSEATDLGGGSYELELEELASTFANGAATLYIPIYVELKSVPVVGRNAAMLKQFPEVHIEFESDRAYDHYVAFETDLSPGKTYQGRPFSTLPPNAGWGFSPWGSGAWGDPGDVASTPLIVPVKKDYARARRFHFWYAHHVSGEKVSLSQVSIPLREISLRSSFKVRS